MAIARIEINSTVGSNDNLELGSTVTLTNADEGGELTYEWAILSQPSGAPTVLSSTSLETVTFDVTKEGSYLIRLIVNKNLADESTDTVIAAVRELQTGNRIPAAGETTENNADSGWANTAVDQILQRVTRMSDAGIFVAENASGGDLSLGKVVHLNGMSTIGTGDNERPIPTVGLALASDLAKVDGPLGVVVGNRDGENLAVAVGALCRVMVMGGLPAYDLGDTAAIGDPIFVDNFGSLSLTAGDYIRQVGDVAKLVSGTSYDIAISAGANSIPRGNALGDLSGMYPDPTVARINATTITTAGGSHSVGKVLRTTSADAADWGAVNLASANSVEGTLPTLRGGTGSSLATMASGGIAYGNAVNTLSVSSGPAGANYFLKSGASAEPSWVQYVPLGSGGTGGDLTAAASYSVIVKTPSQLGATAAPTANQVLRAGSVSPFAPAFGAINLASTAAVSGTLPVTSGGTGVASLTLNGVVYGGGTGDVAVTSAGSSGAILTGTIAGVPTWKTAGSAGQILTLVNVGPGINALDWQDFATYFDDQYAGSSTATDALFSTTGAGYQEIVSVTRSCKRGMVQVTPMPIADGAAFINYITTAATNTYSTVSLKFVVTFPDASIQNYLYQFRSSTAHNNNQNTGSITFPSFTFYTSQEGDHTVSMQVQMSINDTFTANATVLRISQG